MIPCPRNRACMLHAHAAAHLHPWPVAEPAGQPLPVHLERVQVGGGCKRWGEQVTATIVSYPKPAEAQHLQAAEVWAAGQAVALAHRHGQVQLCEGCQCCEWRQVITVQLQVFNRQLLQLAAGGRRGVHHELRACTNCGRDVQATLTQPP